MKNYRHALGRRLCVYIWDYIHSTCLARQEESQHNNYMPNNNIRRPNHISNTNNISFTNNYLERNYDTAKKLVRNALAEQKIYMTLNNSLINALAKINLSGSMKLRSGMKIVIWQRSKKCSQLISNYKDYTVEELYSTSITSA